MTVFPVPNILSFRHQFPALETKAYFNYGGQGPLPQPASAAIAQAFTFEQEAGPFCTKVSTWQQEEVAQLRTQVATMLNTVPERICLTSSTTVGMNIPAWGVHWQLGDQLLLTDAEHPGVVAIGQALAERFGVQVVEVPLQDCEDPVATLKSYLTDRSRMVMLSHILWNSGRVLPLKALAECCHEREVLLHVDAAQSAGVLPLDLPATGVDYYAFTGHKWLCGPSGVGALYLSEAAQQRISATFVGWRGLYGQNSASIYEVSTTGWPLLIGWQASLRCHDQFGPAQDRYTRQVQNARQLWSQLRDMAGVHCLLQDPPESGLVAFTLEGHTPAHVEATLANQGILLRSIPDPVCLRASVHYFTTEQDIERLVEAIQHISRA